MGIWKHFSIICTPYSLKRINVINIGPVVGIFQQIACLSIPGMYSPENKTETGPWIFNWKITKSKSLAWHGWCWFLIVTSKAEAWRHSVNDLFEKYFVGASYTLSCGMRHINELFKPAWLSTPFFFSSYLAPPRLWCFTKNVFIQDELIAISADQFNCLDTNGRGLKCAEKG